MQRSSVMSLCVYAGRVAIKRAREKQKVNQSGRALFARGLTLIPICRSDWIGRPRIGFPFHNPL